MVRIGYTMMTEQAGPRELVQHVVRAEEAGFDFSVTSDHYFPWLAEQGHSPYAWSVLGAAAQATSRIPLMTYVTCPTMRYHPAVVDRRRSGPRTRTRPSVSRRSAVRGRGRAPDARTRGLCRSR
ncbi:F420-dependent glucose-6-phosphate dehydrogenase [Streptomyces tendae]